MFAAEKQIRAKFDNETIRVYQAYNNAIANEAIKTGRFVSPPFKLDRMTWIKPSFLWMMYRCGWGRKDEGQCRILAIDITRTGFEWALKHSCLSHRPESMPHEDWVDVKNSYPVRIQWDPERDIELNKLEYRSIQIGLSGIAVEKYVHDWIVNITDITKMVHSTHYLLQTGQMDAAIEMIPVEEVYNVSDRLMHRLDIKS